MEKRFLSATERRTIHTRTDENRPLPARGIILSSSSTRPRPETVPCPACPLRRQPAFREFDQTELALVAEFKVGELHVTAGSDILLAGANAAHLFTLYSGWAFRYILLPDGRRQILNFILPGDLIGLQASVLDQMEHSVQALTDAMFCVFERQRLWRLYQEAASLAFDVTWLASHEESLVDASLASVGQRPATGRLAFLFLHLWRRLEGLGLINRGRCAFPLTQQHLADAVGLSLVHTNRSLRRLVGQGLVTLGQGRLALPQPQALEHLLGSNMPAQRPRPII